MKILVIADIDDLHWNVNSRPADLLIACGDVCEQVILEAAASCGSKCIFAVKGNHDNPALFPSPIQDLHLQIAEYRGLRFGGFNGAWRYKPRGAFLYDQAEVTRLMADFPPVDIFIAHNSPRYIHDKEDGIHEGFNALNAYIERHAPTMLIHGHQHNNVQSRHLNSQIVGVYQHRRLVI